MRGKIFQVVGLGAITAIVGLGLTGCIPSPVAGQSERALADMVTHTPDGYSPGELHKGACGIDYCNWNASVGPFMKSSTEDVQHECAVMVRFAASLGATNWFYDPEYIPFPLVGYEKQAQIGCTMVMSTDFGGGSTTFGFRGIHHVDDIAAPFNLELGFSTASPASASATPPASATDPVTRSWHMSYSTIFEDTDARFANPSPTWEEAMQAVSAHQNYLNTVLDAVGTYRAAHPDDDPYSADSLHAALESLPDTIHYAIPVNGDGTSTRIGVNSPLGGEVCLSLKTFDPELMGTDDPGAGYTAYVATETFPDDRFGKFTVGECSVID